MAESSELTGYLKKMYDDKLEKEKRNKGKEKRFTVVLSEYDFKRLSFIASEFGEPKSTFARAIIIQSLADAEKILGLKEWETDKDTLIILGEDAEYRTVYGEYLNSPLDPLDDIE